MNSTIDSKYTQTVDGEQIRGPLVRECGTASDGTPLHTYESLVSQAGKPDLEMIHGGIRALFQMAVNFAGKYGCCVREYELVVNATQFTLEAYYHARGQLPDVTEQLRRYLLFCDGQPANKPAVRVEPTAGNPPPPVYDVQGALRAFADGEKRAEPSPKIAVAITTFNEIERSDGRWLRENIEAILKSRHVGDIVVVNDASPDYAELSAKLYQWFGTRVRVQQNPENLAVFGNKLTSLEASKGDWVVIADSDNVFGADYFQRLIDCQPWDPNVAYVASFGRTEFDYQAMIGDWTLANAAEIPRHKCGWCLCNCGNWFVNRERFLAAFDGIPRKRFDLWQPNYLKTADRTPIACRHAYDSLDSYFINKMWWLAGGTLRVVDGLEYVHRVSRDKPGNFDRGPPEKEALGPIYLVEIMDAAAGAKHGYTLIEQGGQNFYLQRDDGATVIVNFHTGDVQVCPPQTEQSQEPKAESAEPEKQGDSSPCENSAPVADSETNFSSGPLSKRTRRRMRRNGASPPGSENGSSDSTIQE